MSRQFRLEWDISQITPAHARIWISVHQDGRQKVLPAVLRWDELGRIARDLGVDLADLTKLELRAGKEGKLISTGVLRDPKSLSNEQIRRKIYEYLSGKTDEKPPVLFADVFKEFTGKFAFILCRNKNKDGQAVVVNLDYFGEDYPFSFVGIRFVSPGKMAVQIFKRTIGTYRDLRIVYQPAPDLKQTAAAVNSKCAEKPEQKVSIIQQSQVVSNWMRDENSIPIVVRRRMAKGKYVTLCSMDGMPYLLAGLGNFSPRLKEVKILLRREEREGAMVRTARLFRVDQDPLKVPPDSCFALYKLPLDSSRGKLIA